LCSALKHRYKETAEKQYGDPGVMAPFSSRQRSGNFKEMISSMIEEHKKETKSQECRAYIRASDKSSPRESLMSRKKEIDDEMTQRILKNFPFMILISLLLVLFSYFYSFEK
jgi:hypothetical protein